MGVSGPGGTWTNQYDVFGGLAATTANGQTTQYLIDPVGLGNVVATYNGSGGLIAHYTYGTGLTSQVDTSNVAKYFDFDAIGSTVGISATTGQYANSYGYRPFGELLYATGGVNNPFQFVGQFGVATDASGLDYTGACIVYTTR